MSTISVLPCALRRLRWPRHLGAVARSGGWRKQTRSTTLALLAVPHTTRELKARGKEKERQEEKERLRIRIILRGQRGLFAEDTKVNGLT